MLQWLQRIRIWVKSLNTLSQESSKLEKAKAMGQQKLNSIRKRQEKMYRSKITRIQLRFDASRNLEGRSYKIRPDEIHQRCSTEKGHNKFLRSKKNNDKQRCYDRKCKALY